MTPETSHAFPAPTAVITPTILLMQLPHSDLVPAEVGPSESSAAVAADAPPVSVAIPSANST